MEDINNTNTTNTSTPSFDSISTKSNVYKYLFFIVVVILLALIAYFYLNNNNRNNLSTISTNNPSEISKSPTPTVTTEKEEIKWATTRDMAAYSFKYPFGWHVADLWPTDTNTKNNYRSIIINSSPIETGARGGPLGDIVIFEKTGSENSEVVFQQEIDNFKKLETNIKEEILQTGIGKIYHYTVKGNAEMGGDYNQERYYLYIKPSSINNRNPQIVFIESYDPQKSDLLKEIVMSIKLE